MIFSQSYSETNISISLLKASLTWNSLSILRCQEHCCKISKVSLKFFESFYLVWCPKWGTEIDQLLSFLLPSSLSPLWAGSQNPLSWLYAEKNRVFLHSSFFLFPFEIYIHSCVQSHLKTSLKWLYIQILIFHNSSLHFTFIDLISIENLQCTIKKA